MLDNNLSGLKLYFYQLDRIISLYLPDLHHSFRREMVNAAYFSSSWFMTLFSNILEQEEGLLEIWDYFLYEGWKFIFKCSVHIL